MAPWVFAEEALMPTEELQRLPLVLQFNLVDGLGVFHRMGVPRSASGPWPMWSTIAGIQAGVDEGLERALA